MEKDNTQKELFEFEAPKGRPRRFGQFFQKTDFAIALSAEKLAFVSIGIIMLLVVSFALGVEKGKAMAGKIWEASPSPTPVQAQVQRTPINAPTQAPAQARAVSAVTNITTKDKTLPYTIVAAAFTKEVFAAKEAGRIKGSGLEAFIIKDDPYYLVCVGAFANKNSAKTVLNKVKQMHRDAYVRLK